MKLLRYEEIVVGEKKKAPTLKKEKNLIT